MISNVYSYYLSQYGNKPTTRYQAHKPSELKSTYSKMLKINKVTPFYKVDVSEDAQKYAIDLKENARELTNIANDLSSPDGASIQMAFKKSAVSSNESAVEAQYIGDHNAPPVNAFEVDVKQLATTQINTGNYLQPTSKHFQPDEYSFDLNISDLTYEFALNVDASDTTKSIQEKISRLINRSNIGLKSSVLSDSLDNSAITIESESTGISNMKPTIFSISNTVVSGNDVSAGNAQDTRDANEHSPPGQGTLTDILGLNRTSQYPSNAIFAIDGNESTSSTNTVTINKAFCLNFKDITTDGPVTVNLKTDSDAIIDSISDLVDGYNNLLSVTSSKGNERFDGNQKLRNEFSSLTKVYNQLLESNGIDIADDGSISINNQAIKDATDSGNITDIFSNLGLFKNAIKTKAETIALNPMDYVNNKIVAYKNPQKSLVDPYNTSAYSGMMFNGYC